MEKRNLIKSAGQEKSQGRIRKLYKITKKGLSEAVSMLNIFGNLNKVILPASKAFQHFIDKHLQNHIFIAFQIMKDLYPMLLPLLQQNLITPETIQNYKIDKNQLDLFRYLLIKN
ncbi:MAG: hypothetical protein GF311_03510 [Candidatus Lokiarchaeota archaeon]|nr:hypothetical protein [Candidatus Lokiarchaeota archaeon]